MANCFSITLKYFKLKEKEVKQYTRDLVRIHVMRHQKRNCLKQANNSIQLSDIDK